MTRRVTLRDLADRQHGPSKAVRRVEWPYHIEFGWCQRCDVPLTPADIEAQGCTQCGAPLPRKRGK